MMPDTPVYDHAAAVRGWGEMLALLTRSILRLNQSNVPLRGLAKLQRKTFPGLNDLSLVQIR